jgi:hypothetical protein
MIDIVPEYRRNMDDAPRPIAAMAKTWAADERIPLHIHRRGQLLHAVSGIMRVETAKAAWIVPPARALWLPPEMPHSIVMRSRLDMRTIYIDRAACDALPIRSVSSCCRGINSDWSRSEHRPATDSVFRHYSMRVDCRSRVAA